MSRPPKLTYQTTHWHAYNQALRQRGSLTVWFDPLMQWEAAPSGRRGRQHAYSDAAIQACLIIKVLFGLPLRHATCFVASLLELSGLRWPVPDLSKRRVWRKIHLGIEEERSRSGRWKSLRAMSAMLRCCRTCMPRSQRTRRSPRLRPTVPTTRGPAMTLSPPTLQRRSFRRDGMRGHGSQTRPGPGHATRACGPRNTLAGRSGGTGAGITAAAGRRRK
ncbi:transposase (plasmid) [Shinella sp. WSC3-e]|nr:transposase [Rhizobiaceae bacterium]CAK7261781.1 transposase [Shinella sp. WSC3-e]